MNSTDARWSNVLGVGLLGAMLLAQPAKALEGYFQHGYGARHKALAGAGVADGRDATIAIINPAGLVHAQNEIDSAFGLFSPTREMVGSGAPGLTPTGKYESNTLEFFIPNLSAAYRVSGNPFVDVVGVSVWGNGAGTNYRNFDRGGGCFNGGSGMFCGGPAGVDLQQMFLTVSVAKHITPDLAVGIGPTLARQQFRAKGLDVFAPVSNSIDQEWGYGVSGGLEWSIARHLRFGAAIASRTYMGSFEKYAGLLADHGDCDVPAFGQAGIAYDAQPNLTLMLDYQHIAYGSIACVANPATSPGPFGAANGPAFGWRDINAVKFGRRVALHARHRLARRLCVQHAAIRLARRAARYPRAGRHAASSDGGRRVAVRSGTGPWSWRQCTRRRPRSPVSRWLATISSRFPPSSTRSPWASSISTTLPEIDDPAQLNLRMPTFTDR